MYDTEVIVSLRQVGIKPCIPSWPIPLTGVGDAVGVIHTA